MDNNIWPRLRQYWNTKSYRTWHLHKYDASSDVRYNNTHVNSGLTGVSTVFSDNVIDVLWYFSIYFEKKKKTNENAIGNSCF